MRPAGTRRFGLLVAVLLLAALPPAPAHAKPVDLVLVIAADVSDSIDGEEVKLQRQGYIDAIAHPRTLQAIKKGKHGRIAVAYFEWADHGNQALIIDWMTIEDEATARDFGARLKPAKIHEGHFTSISSAIEFALALLKKSPYQAKRRVVDISGDGRNNHGGPLGPVRQTAREQKITINGLPIVNDRGRHYTGQPPEFIAEYYRKEVIVGENAFIVTAKNFFDFERAISRKLFREISGLEPREVLAERPAP